MTLTAQIIGFAGMGIMFCAYQQRTQKNIMLWQIAAISVFTLHFFLLKQYTGAVLNLLGVFRAVLYYHIDKKWASNIAWKLGLSAAFVATGILSWKDIYSLFPILSMLLSTFVFAIQKPSLLRKLLIPCSILWLVYNIHASSYAGTITECFAIVSVIIAMIRYDLLKKKEKHKL